MAIGDAGLSLLRYITRYFVGVTTTSSEDQTVENSLRLLKRIT
jgi:hypothetical protein